MKKLGWLLGAVAVAAVLMWQLRAPTKAVQDEFAGWVVLEAKPPADFNMTNPLGLAQLVELQLFARGIAGVKELSGPLQETLALPTQFGLPEVDDDQLRGAVPLVVRRKRGRWDEAMHMPRLAYLLQKLQARSTRHLAVSLFPSRRPMPKELTAVIEKAQLFLLRGPQAARSSAETQAAFDHLSQQGASVLWSRRKPKTEAEAAAVLVLAGLSQGGQEEAIVIDPAGLDVEAHLKARLPGGVRIQSIGQAGQIYYDERWMTGPGAKAVLEASYRKKTAGWVSQDGRELLILLAHKTGLPLPSLKGLAPEPGLTLMPLGASGEIGFSPFAARLPALRWERALVDESRRSRFLQPGLVRIYLRLDPKAGLPSLDGLEGPTGWGLRLQSPPEED